MMFLRVNSKTCNFISNAVRVVFAVVLTAGTSQNVFAKASAPFMLPAGLDNEGCVGGRQSYALEELKERLPVANPVVIASCREADERCDGGFVWQPYMINQDRGWVLYTLPKKGNWVGVLFRNICTHRRVLRGDFLNEETSSYLRENSAYAVGWNLDHQQTLFSDYENIATRLFRSNGEYRVEIFGWNEERTIAWLLDSFPVSPL